MLTVYAFVYIAIYVGWHLLDLPEPDDGREHFRFSRQHELRERLRDTCPPAQISLGDYRI